MAADSAASTGSKIHKTADKLFTLSKYYPVGIMVYNSSAFMGVPWESIIKVFRNNFDKKHHPTLKEYADEFINSLDGNESIVSLSVQKQFFKLQVESYFNELKESIKDFIKDQDETTKLALNLVSVICPDSVDEDEESQEFDQLNKMLRTDLLKIHTENLKNKVMEDLGELPEHFISDILGNKEYKEIIQNASTKFFDDMEFDNDPTEELGLVAVYGFYDTNSGVVIAGFGDDELYPSVISYTICGMINNKLKILDNSNETASIAIDDSARIIPFAQHEMVDSFLEGVIPEYDEYSEGYLERLFNDLPSTFLQIVEEVDDGTGSKLIDELKEKVQKIEEETKVLFDDYKNEMKNQKKKHEYPILMAVATLPKDDLASMAESLVHLTSLKRKFTFHEDETVGGAIDVAVISKGDGFVWIKRKHYFKAELNPQFFNKYFYKL